MNIKKFLFIILILLVEVTYAQKLIPVADGWANNSVNVAVFRKNSLVTQNNVQFIAYYDPDGFLTLGKRGLNQNIWEINKTQYTGKVVDAHNIISIMVDGDGFLHVSWNHHGSPLNYVKSIAPYSLQLGEKETMVNSLEQKVTYPEFHKFPDGNLIFMYRDGQSGKGNLVMNKYDVKSKSWTRLQENLIDGESQRNAYWQACIDNNGVIHVSWVWRETSDVATNHDLCYARSIDGGQTWENSKSEKYDLPINAQTAEYALKIPQNSELINQTSMTTDENGKPYIASYWKVQDLDIPQFHVVYNDGKGWHVRNLNFRKMAFSLKGGGTKRIPISRPQIIVRTKKNESEFILIFRDEEFGEKVSVAICRDIRKNEWEIKNMTSSSVGSWEPTFDTELWRNNGLLHIFVQKTYQVDGEGKADIAPQLVQVLEIDFSESK